jgi:hypothetical protein
MCLLVKLVLEFCVFYLRDNSAGVKSCEKHGVSHCEGGNEELSMGRMIVIEIWSASEVQGRKITYTSY